MKKVYLKILMVIAMFSGCDASSGVVVEGEVKVKGSAPHTYLVIQESKTHKDLRVSNWKQFNLSTMQNKSIKAKIKLIKKPIGPGFPAVVEIVEIVK